MEGRKAVVVMSYMRQFTKKKQTTYWKCNLGSLSPSTSREKCFNTLKWRIKTLSNVHYLWSTLQARHQTSEKSNWLSLLKFPSILAHTCTLLKAWGTTSHPGIRGLRVSTALPVIWKMAHLLGSFTIRPRRLQEFSWELQAPVPLCAEGSISQRWSPKYQSPSSDPTSTTH